MKKQMTQCKCTQKKVVSAAASVKLLVACLNYDPSWELAFLLDQHDVLP